MTPDELRLTSVAKPRYGAITEDVAVRPCLPRIRAGFGRLVPLLGLAFVTGAFVTAARRARIHEVSLERVSKGSSRDGSSQQYCDDGLCVLASNSYERSLGRPIANGLYDGIILELYQETMVEVVADECEFEVSEELTVVSEYGCELALVATSVGTYELTATATTGGVPTKVTFELVGKYVRREVRDLSEGDRTRFLDAIAVTHAVPTDAGERMYGPAYKSTTWFATVHATYSADRDCDHWHSGPGFVNQHSAFTLRYQQALQAVDPRTCALASLRQRVHLFPRRCVHYWDFTIEGASVECCFTESVLWSPDWFSTVSPNNTEHVLDTGRWAFTRVEKVNSGLLNANNAYGLLGNPWNTNPLPFHHAFTDPSTASQTTVSIPAFDCETFRYTFENYHSFGTVWSRIEE